MSPEINLTIDYTVYIIKNRCAKCDLEKCTVVGQIPIKIVKKKGPVLNNKLEKTQIHKIYVHELQECVIKQGSF